jgi:hypothetical protein
MRSRHRVTLASTVCVLAIVCGLAALAAKQDGKPGPPTTPAAKAARKKFDAAVAKADEARRVAVLAATRTYVKELEASQRTVAAAAKTEEVTRIAAALEEAKRSLDPDDKADAKPKAGRVLSSKVWQPVLRVKKGQVLRITATGTWHVSPELECGPEGLKGHWVHDNKPSGLLIARIGRQTFDVGPEAEITAPADGLLEMSCNGGDESKEDDDYLDVTIVVASSAKQAGASDDD